MKKKTLKREIIPVIIGNNDLMTYVMVGFEALSFGKNIEIKARGNRISKAVDVAEILRKRMGLNIAIDKIVTTTEEFIKNNVTLNVSNITIILKEVK